MTVVRDRLKLVSHFPGRLRVRAGTFRVMPEVAEEVAQRLAEEPGISSVERSHLTGSIVVCYDPRVLELPRLTALLVRMAGLHGLEVGALDVEEHRHGKRVRETLGTLNRSVQNASKGRLDLRVAVPGTLAALGGAMFLAGSRRTPEWYDLLFWSFVTFANLNPRGAEGVQETRGPSANDPDGRLAAP